MDPLAPLYKYAQNQSQLAWIRQQLALRPLYTNESPEDWLVWRSRVGLNGMDEIAAWNSCRNENLFQTDFQPFPIHPNSIPTGPVGTLSTSPVGTGLPAMQGFQFHHHHQQQQQQAFAPFSPTESIYRTFTPEPQPSGNIGGVGFVSLQQVAPRSSSAPVYAYPSTPQSTSQLEPALSSSSSTSAPSLLGYAQPTSIAGYPSIGSSPSLPSSEVKEEPHVTAQAEIKVEQLIEEESQPRTEPPVKIVAQEEVVARGTERVAIEIPLVDKARLQEFVLSSSPFAALVPYASSSINEKSVPPRSRPRPSGKRIEPVIELSKIDKTSLNNANDSSSFLTIPKKSETSSSSTVNGSNQSNSNTANTTTTTTTTTITTTPSGIVIRPPKETRTWSEISQLLGVWNLQTEQKPSSLFKYLRWGEVKGELISPQFEPNPTQLVEIIEKIRKYATSLYLQKMADNDKYSELLARWLKKFLKEPKTYENAIAPLFWVLSRTDMPVDYIEEMRFQILAEKILNKVFKLDLGSKFEVEKAFAAYMTFCKEVLFVKNRKGYVDDDDDPPAKKQKTEVGDSSKPSTSTAAAKATTSSPRSTAPTAVSSSTASAKSTLSKTSTGAKPDLSFFKSSSSTATTAGPSSSGAGTGAGAIAAKPKTKIPDFKKAEPPRPPISIPSSTTVPQPPLANSILSQIMNKLKGPEPFAPPLPQSGGSSVSIDLTANTARVPQPLTTRPSISGAEGSASSVIGGVLSGPGPKPNTRGFTVKWADERPPTEGDGGRQLEMIRFFEEEPWEMEPAPWQVDGMGNEIHGLSSHQLDMQEGRALKIHDDEVEIQVIDWYDPPFYHDAEKHFLETEESVEQESRARSNLAANYLPNTSIPDPTETCVRIVTSGSDTQDIPLPVYLEPVEELPSTVASALNPIQQQAPTASVSDLLKSLNPQLFNVSQHSSTPAAYSQQAQPATQSYQPRPTQQYGYGQPVDDGYGARANSGWPSAARSEYDPNPLLPPTAGQGLGQYRSNYDDANLAYGPGSNGRRFEGYDRENDRKRERERERDRDRERERSSGSRNGRSTGNRIRRTPCKFFAEGSCRLGNKCTFLH